MTKFKSTSGTAELQASAVHHQEGQDHLVGIANLRVILCQEGDFWFAQGIEIDYSAEGYSQDEVKAKFQDGLCATINLHLQKFGGLAKLLKWTPASEWKDLLGDRVRLTQISYHSDVRDAFCFPEEFPFAGIDYLQRVAA